ncbi:MAG: hypothetical protein Kow0049_06940 [Stanieria sp.]
MCDGFIMEPDFARYIEIVGKNKVKESLKDKLQEAIKKEDWNLAKEITNLIESNFNNQANNNTQMIALFSLSKVKFQEDIFLAGRQTEIFVTIQNINIQEIWVKLKNLIVKKFEIDEEIVEIEAGLVTLLHKKEDINIEYVESFLQNPNLPSSLRYIYEQQRSFYWGKDDWLYLTELIMAVEEEFDIEISDEKAEKIYSVQDLFDVIIFCLQNQ